MKQIVRLRNKITEVPVSTYLLWFGLLIVTLTAVLQFFIPIAQWVQSILALVGVVLSGYGKIVGDREQGQQLAQERKRDEAVAQNMAINATKLRIESNVNNRPPETMPTRESQVIQKRNNA